MARRFVTITDRSCATRTATQSLGPTPSVPVRRERTRVGSEYDQRAASCRLRRAHRNQTVTEMFTLFDGFSAPPTAPSR